MGSFEVIRAMGRQIPGLRVSMVMHEDNAQKINAMLAASIRKRRRTSSVWGA